MNLKPGGSGGFCNAYHQIKCATAGGRVGGKVVGGRNLRRWRKEHEREARELDLCHLRIAIKNASSPGAIEKRKQTMKKNCHQQGEKNSNFGKMWITNGEISITIKRDEEMPHGFRKGRVITHK